MIYPFVLRRTKAQVATELPPKIENVSYAGMLPRQESMYRITRELYQGKIARSIEENGVEGSRMQILEALLRLRQICCHPALVDPSFSGDSGKFRLVDQLLEEVIEGGHRALIFSQFVSALELLRKRLTARSIRTELLTGKTANRAAAVDNFQQDPSIPVFLISLKAGGVGLNLTAADYVIHLDPWWNPAIENQASDRAYRIGQTRQVFVYKLITRDSVEERVLEFQRRKQHLIGSVITTEQGLFKRMTPDDVTEMFS
jgi:non-specific serine/threonine protein kinase